MASKQAAAQGRGEKRKRVVLTLREKIDICTRLERGESRKALMQEYNVGMSTLYDIKAHKAQLLRFFANSDSNQALEQRRTLHTPKLEHLDRVLYEWFLVKRAEGVPVSGPMLIEKAKDLYEQMQLAEPCVFSGGWLWRFKARHGIRKLDASSEKQGTDHQAAEQFCGFFRSLAAEHRLSPEQVYNADETGLFWRCLPSPGTDGGTVPSLKPGKDRLTVLLCANATGSHRIKPLAIGKGGGPRAFRGIQHLPVAHGAQASAWVDQEIFSDWFHHVFVPSVREHFRTIGLPAGSKAVLLLDSSRAHPAESELVSDNIFTIFLPAGVASLLQPMEQGIRRDFMRHFVSLPVTLHGFHARHSANDTIFSVACAWEAVPSQVFRQAWRKLWPAVALATGSSEEVVGMVTECHNAKPHYKAFAHILGLKAGPPCPGSRPQDSEAWGRGARREAVSEATGPGEQAERDSGEDEAAWEQAAASFEAVLCFAEQQPCFTEQETEQLRVLHSAFCQRRQLRRQQAALQAGVKPEAFQERPGADTPTTHSPLPCSSAAGDNGGCPRTHLAAVPATL
ncbi:PREDICTED: jerky protein homolog [Dipodomys ordii]|uniref:Jerky protein homolog n=1 Tax=Dipodomys ordii TaxID=10020 RepID=A0A1S3FXU1_DIPOR|nr:PREDICTED: jerky protein homolog [Dipodomys ordii]XP_012880656.1 PREDICTED: jerky protein homolog [Dipodomys ordii]XP_012880657.1 PREDICTED: jerky protein homolog [Dipodomys ordii]XP_012880658.1 PREDICTED: jerky protein homolog [Dipodomys ordii]XP_012880659.1 PREDICTED: jerky protein homolog [Dipodomys ordii]